MRRRGASGHVRMKGITGVYNEKSARVLVGGEQFAQGILQ